MNKKEVKKKTHQEEDNVEEIVGVSKIMPSKIFRKWSMLAGSSVDENSKE